MPVIALTLTGMRRMTIAVNDEPYTFENTNSGTQPLGGYALSPGMVITLTAITPPGQKFFIGSSQALAIIGSRPHTHAERGDAGGHDLPDATHLSRCARRREP